MADADDFASFMSRSEGAVLAELSPGQTVRGAITQISGDSVFVDLGTRAEGRIPRSQLELRDGSLPVKVGDDIQATVVDTSGSGGPLLAVKFGKEQRVDLAALSLAHASQTPIVGTVSRAVKGGLELELNGARAFCPASQVDRSYVADLTRFVGEDLSVLITEVREDDLSVVVSRRRALEVERAQQAAAATEKLAVGQDLTGTVASLQRYGAFVDLGGVEGLVHISELSRARVERVEDVVAAGEQVQVRVIAIEAGDKGPRIRLSMKALQQPDPDQAPTRREVLKAKVLRLLPHGVLVATDKGEGFVPKRELALPPGADHRRALSVDQELEVALLDGTPDRLRFSVTRVEDVLAGQDFRAYQEHASDASAGLGNMASLLGGIDRRNLPKGPSAPPPSRPASTPPRSAEQPAAQPAPLPAPQMATPRQQGSSDPTRIETGPDSEDAARQVGDAPANSDAVTPPKRRRRIVSSAGRPGKAKPRQ